MKKKCKYDKRPLRGMCAGFLILAFSFFSCGDGSKKKSDVTSQQDTTHIIYYCPMHPEIQQDHPGTCPKPECKGMELIKKDATDLLNSVLQPANSVVVSSIKVIKPEEKEISMDIDANGYLDYDNRTKKNIASKLNGRIEKLYIKYNYQPINAGDIVFDIYSPDLVTAQENLIFLWNNDPAEEEMINNAKIKLKLLGFTNKEIEELEKTKKAKLSFPITSKWSGHIHEMTELNNSGKNSESMSGILGSQNSSKSDLTIVKSSSELSIKEGMYILRGQTIFNVVDPHLIVAMLQINIKDIRKIKLNQEVEMLTDENPVFKIKGEVSFIDPIIAPGAKTLLVRVDIQNNEHKHKIGSLVKAHIIGEKTEGLWIPASSVVDLGNEKIVWLKKEDHFEVRKIEIGASSSEWIEIYDGITKKDEIAQEAHYLSDSEGFIKVPENNPVE